MIAEGFVRPPAYQQSNTWDIEASLTGWVNAFSYARAAKNPRYGGGAIERIHNLGEYFTIQGAAQQLGSTWWIVYGHIRKHRVPTLRLGRTVLVRLADLPGLERKGVTMAR
jgi:hypothetical protein